MLTVPDASCEGLVPVGLPPLFRVSIACARGFTFANFRVGAPGEDEADLEVICRPANVDGVAPAAVVSNEEIPLAATAAVAMPALAVG